MKSACPRLFEVEALRDGRLSGAEAARVETHLGICSVCAHEARSLQALATALRTTDSAANELHVRRERTRLLAAFDASLVPAPHERRIKPWLAAVAGLALVGTLVGLSWPEHRPITVRSNTAAIDPVRIRADSLAHWSRQTHPQFEKITLENGTLSIRVDHARATRRLLIILPDGELEDIGTTFSVSVEAGRTSHVTVQEGSVVLRLGGRAALALALGKLGVPAHLRQQRWWRPLPPHRLRASNARVPSRRPPSLRPATPRLSQRRNRLSIFGRPCPRSTRVTTGKPPRSSPPSSRSTRATRAPRMPHTFVYFACDAWAIPSK